MLRFITLTFSITLSTGILVVLSNRAQLVNGARPIPHPLPLPMPLAITLIVLGGWAPGLAAIAVTAWEEGRPGVRGCRHPAVRSTHFFSDGPTIMRFRLPHCA